MVVSTRSVPFTITSCTRLSLPPLHAPAPPHSLSCTHASYVCSQRYLMLAPSGLGRDVGTLSQTLTGHAGAIGLAVLASRILER